MALFNRLRKRRVFNPTVAALTAASAVIPEAHAAVKPKSPGETKIVAVMGGDYGHNSIPLEMHVRDIFSSKKDCRVLFVQAARFFTPELISDADLLIVSRHSRPDDIAWRPDGIVDTMEKGSPLWIDENVKAIIDNVRSRGMGFMALHCTIACNNRNITDLLDIEPIMHNEIQPVWVGELNSQHPITKGIGKFFINLDEQFAAIIKSRSTTTLFKTTAIHDKRIAVGGWCLESGNGRVVGLLPGHTEWPYRVREYQDILWRSAHWAIKQDIPSYPGVKG